MNFINYLDIFFNEIRKFDIACGEYEGTGQFQGAGLRNIRKQKLRELEEEQMQK